MSDHGTISMQRCSYCGLWHTYSEEMCRDVYKIAAGRPCAFTELTVNAPCDSCEYRKAAALRDDGWVSVKERLPRYGGPYIIHRHTGRIDLWEYINEHDWIENGVTHWRQLPEPPKEEG